MRRFTNPKRRPYVVLGMALLALTFGVTVASTDSGAGQTKAAIFKNSFNRACPEGFGNKPKKIGTVTAIREKGLATFRGKLHNAAPGTYAMKLYDSQCAFLLKLGEFNVDGSGDGSFAEQARICPGQTYFLDFQHGGDGMHNSTRFFKLGSDGPEPSSCSSGTAGINIVKFTNGDDANSPPGPIVAEFDLVTWTYVVTNTGNVPLSDVVVTDDQIGEVTSFTGDTNGNGLLDLSETWTYTDSATATDGQYENVGTVNAESPVGQLVTDSNLSHYFGTRPIP
jgi:uncharacterized repeat protein (TIGR01451 family)